MSVRLWLLMSLGFALACSSKAGSQPTSPDAAPEATSSDAGEPGAAIVHGTMVDFETLHPVAGLTLSSDGASTTTDKSGHWSLSAPHGGVLHATVTGPSYSHVRFPDFVIVDADVDLGTVVIPDSNTYDFEGQVLSGFDGSKALVHLVILTAPTCASPVGGTITVTAPSGTSIAYFNSSAMPSRSVTSFQQVADGRPVAVVYNIDSSAALELQVTHPTCKQAPFPATYGGRQYPGTVALQPAQPGGSSAATVIVLE